MFSHACFKIENKNVFLSLSIAFLPVDCVKLTAYMMQGAINTARGHYYIHTPVKPT